MVELVVNKEVLTEVEKGNHEFGIRPARDSNQPEKRRNIIVAAALKHGFKLTAAERGTLELAAVAHSAHYISFLKEAYEAWLRTGNSHFSDGTEEKGLVPYFFLKTHGVVPPGEGVEAAAAFYATDNTTPIYPDTHEVLADDMGVIKTAVETISRCWAVYALTTNPGHHAGPYNYGGYCYLNNAAIAAKMLLAQGHRVAVLDVDYHGGDGTLKFDLPRFASINTPGDYPYVDMGQCGYLLKPKQRWAEYAEVLQDILSQWHNSVEVLIVSLGFDTLEDDSDPRAELGQCLCPKDFQNMASVLMKTGFKILILQEGGYKLEDVGDAATFFLAGCHQ